jgi:hypothetical protein
VATSLTHGRALRYAGGSARGLLHHVPGHCPEDLDLHEIALRKWMRKLGKEPKHGFPSHGQIKRELMVIGRL